MKNGTETIFNCYGNNNAIYYKKDAKGNKTNEPDNLTIRELCLGLKIDHLPTVLDPFAPVSDQEMNNQKRAMAEFDWTELFVTRKDLGLLAPTPAGTKKNLPPTTPAEAKIRWEQMSQTQKEQRIELSAQEKTMIQDYTQYQQILLNAYKTKTNDDNATIDVFERYMFPWYIFLIGHGREGTQEGRGTIATFSINEFLSFVKFLNFVINTKFLFYVTCYGGGQHTDPMYQYTYEDLEKKVQNNRIITTTVLKKIPYNLNYTITVGASTDAPADGTGQGLFGYPFPPLSLIVVDGISVPFRSRLRFDTFFNEIAEYFNSPKLKNDPNYKSLAKIVNLVANTSPATNKPLIRFANTETFKAIELEQEIDIIDKKAITEYLQQNKKSFDAKKFVLFLHESYIPMKIVFQHQFATILPMNTATNSYFFENVELFRAKLMRIFAAFLPQTIYNKNIYIKKLEAIVSSNENLPGDLGNPANKKEQIKFDNEIKDGIRLDLHDVTINTGSVNKVRFIFTLQGKQSFYESSFKALSDLEKNLKVVNNQAEIERYALEFAQKEKELKGSFTEFEQQTQKINESLPQKQKAVEQDLIWALKNMSNSLNSIASALR